jgi:hypothetical protein
MSRQLFIYFKKGDSVIIFSFICDNKNEFAPGVKKHLNQGSAMKLLGDTVFADPPYALIT